MNFISCIILFVLFLGIHSSRILELTDKFSDIRREGGYWLVKFYAPWCGHCKKLEPVWSLVAQSLSKSNVRVSRIDCSRFPSAASEFGIRGYPTIKFITADSEYTFRGDKTKDDIINFAVRMTGPPIEIVKSEQEGNLWEVFQDVAAKLQPYGYFYSINKELLQNNENISELPSVFVYKDGLSHFYPVNRPNEEYNSVTYINDLNLSLYNWVNEERFELFPKVTRGTINEIIQTNKYIVLVVVEENRLQQIPADMLEFRDKVENLVRKNRSKYHKHFQFGWVGNPDFVNSIAMRVLPLPQLLVLNSTNHQYHLPEVNCSEMSSETIEVFLEGIRNQSVPAFGGDGLFISFYRAYFDATSALADIWRGNPVLTTVLFGLPVAFLSFIFISVCCSDILDAEDEAEENHAKEE
ncbi:thioredoxin-related transmembrane protein 3 isoform X2 [Leptinotarsa decemlineata]|uniref:thioredoxin-related transmembrane protein 3 isoform X2 n=1 Tax=Leptinotarsa decemlineata TaxID=7539 RepID=UPI003D30D0A2